MNQFNYYIELLKELHSIETLQILEKEVRLQALRLIKSGKLESEYGETVEDFQNKLKCITARIVEVA